MPTLILNIKLITRSSSLAALSCTQHTQSKIQCSTMPLINTKLVPHFSISTSTSEYFKRIGKLQFSRNCVRSLAQKLQLIRLWADSLLTQLIIIIQVQFFHFKWSVCHETTPLLSLLLYVNWTLVRFLLSALRLGELHNHGCVANQLVCFQVNFSVLRLQCESDSTLKSTSLREREQLSCRFWVVVLKWIVLNCCCCCSKVKKCDSGQKNKRLASVHKMVN